MEYTRTQALAEIEKEKQRRNVVGNVKSTTPAHDEAAEKAAIDEFLAMVDKVSDAKKEPGRKDLEALRAGFKRWPDFLRVGGNMAHQTRDRIIRESTRPTDYITQQAMWAAIETLQADLGYQDSPPLEKLLIEQIVNCWLSHYINENKYGGVVVQGVTLDQGAYWERKMLASQKRYLRAIEALARVRKLALPQPAALQINLGDKQVNIATLTADPAIKQN